MQGHLGELSISLCYDSSLSCLTVGVNSARNLKSLDLIGLSGQSDPCTDLSHDTRTEFYVTSGVVTEKEVKELGF